MEPEDALALQRIYLEALLRVEAHAAEVAADFGLVRLGELIRAERRCIEGALVNIDAALDALRDREPP